jgi:hypothetical protein
MTDLFKALAVAIPIVLGIFGALFLYFGRLTTLFYITKSEKIDDYINGLLFLLFFIAAPFLIYIIIRLCFISNSTTQKIWIEFLENIVTNLNFILTEIQLIIFIPVFIMLYATVIIRKESMSYHEYYRRRIFIFNSNNEASSHYLERFLKYILFHKMLLLILLYTFSFMIFLPVLVCLDDLILIPINVTNLTELISDIKIVYFLSSLFYWIAIITCIAIIYGYMNIKYPFCAVYYEIPGNVNPGIRYGKITALTNDFISIKNGNRSYQINKDKIIEIQRML